MIQHVTGPDGYPFWIPTLPNIVTQELSAGRYWEPYFLPLFDACCRPDQLTVEIGAYIGDHTIALAARGPVLAIEPQPIPWALVGLNLAARPHPYTWTTLRALLYSHWHTLAPGPDWQTDHPSNTFAPGTGLMGLPLDDLPRPAQRVGFLKIDAQGCDLRVLVGAEGLIARDRPIILCEFNLGMAAAHGDNEESYRRWFQDHAYRLAGFMGENILGVPEEIAPEPYWTSLTEQGVVLTP